MLRSVLAVLVLLASAGTAVGSAAAPAAAATTVPVKADPQDLVDTEIVISYIAGSAFAVAAILDFKENPQQVTITLPTPIPIPDPQDIIKVVTVISYIGGAGFAVGAIIKFKQHKDNPTQTHINFPIPIAIPH